LLAGWLEQAEALAKGVNWNADPTCASFCVQKVPHILGIIQQIKTMLASQPRRTV
jgi:hypothetical protein